MDVVLPNANELRKVTEQARETQHKKWIEDIKRDVINAAASGLQAIIIDDPYKGKYENEIRAIFEPLGYTVKVNKNSHVPDYFEITW